LNLPKFEFREINNYNDLDYSFGVGNYPGISRYTKHSIHDEKRNQTCHFSKTSTKLVFILTRNKISKLNNFGKYFDLRILM